MSKYTGGYDYPQSSATRSYSTGSGSGSQALGSSYGHTSGGYQSSQRPQRHASYGSSYDIGTRYGGSSDIGSKYSGSSDAGNRYGTSDIGSKYGGSSDPSSRYGGGSTDYGTKYVGSSDLGSRYSASSDLGTKYTSSDLGSKYTSSDLGTKYGGSSESRTKYGGGGEFGTSYGGASSEKYGGVSSIDSSSRGRQGSELKPKYSNRYGDKEESNLPETQTARKVRPPYERYKPLSADDNPPQSQDVDVQEIRSRSLRYRSNRDDRKDTPPDATQIKGSFQMYRSRKPSDIGGSSDLEKPVFSSVEDSVESLNSASFNEKWKRGSSGDSQRGLEQTRDSLEKPSFGSFEKDSFENKDSTEFSQLAPWKQRRLEREQKEKRELKRAEEESEKTNEQATRTLSSQHVPTQVKEQTTDQTNEQEVKRRSILEKLERPKSVDADAIKHLLLTSESPLLRSRYREAVRKRDHLKESLDGASDISQDSESKSRESSQAKEWSSAKALHESLRHKEDMKVKELGETASDSVRKSHARIEDLKNSVQQLDEVPKSQLNRSERLKQDNMEQNRLDSKKRILVSSRSNVDTVRDSVKQTDVEQNASNVPKTTVSKTSNETPSIKPENLYSRKKLSSSDTKDETNKSEIKKPDSATSDDKLSKYYSSGSQEKIQTNVQLYKDNKSESEKKEEGEKTPSKRAIRLGRARHHGQEGPSLVKHMSDLLFEDPKSIRSERRHTSEEKDTTSHQPSAEKSSSILRTSVATSDTDKPTPEPLTSARSIRSAETVVKSIGDKLKSQVDKTQKSATDTSPKEADAVDKPRFQRVYGRAKTTDVSSLLVKKAAEQKTDNKTSDNLSKTTDSVGSKSNTPKTEERIRTQERSKTPLAKIEEKPKDSETKHPESVGDLTFPSAFSVDVNQMSRAERIARYKEERKKQLAHLATMFTEPSDIGGAKELVPSLFTASREGGEGSLGRSKSMREGSPQKFSSPVARSKSLREDLSLKKEATESVPETEEEAPPSTEMKSFDESGKTIPLTMKIAQSRKLFERKLSEDEDTKTWHRRSLTDSPHEGNSRRSSSSSDRRSIGDESSIEKLKHRYLFGTDFSEAKTKRQSLTQEVAPPPPQLDTSTSSDEVTSTTVLSSSISSEDPSVSEEISFDMKKARQAFSKPEPVQSFMFGTAFSSSKEAKPVSNLVSTENSKLLEAEKTGLDGEDSDAARSQKRRRQLPSIPSALGTGSPTDSVSSKNESESDQSQQKNENVQTVLASEPQIARAKVFDGKSRTSVLSSKADSVSSPVSKRTEGKSTLSGIHSTDNLVSKEENLSKSDVISSPSVRNTAAPKTVSKSVTKKPDEKPFSHNVTLSTIDNMSQEGTKYAQQVPGKTERIIKEQVSVKDKESQDTDTTNKTGSRSTKLRRRSPVRSRSSITPVKKSIPAKTDQVQDDVEVSTTSKTSKAKVEKLHTYEKPDSTQNVPAKTADTKRSTTEASKPATQQPSHKLQDQPRKRLQQGKSQSKAEQNIQEVKPAKTDKTRSKADVTLVPELHETLESQFMVPIKTLTESCDERVANSDSSPRPENVPNFGTIPDSESALRFDISREEMVLNQEPVSKSELVSKAAVTRQTFKQVPVTEELKYETSKSEHTGVENVPRSHSTPEPETALKYDQPRAEMVLSPEQVSKPESLARTEVKQKQETYEAEQVSEGKTTEGGQVKKSAEESGKQVKKRSFKIRHSRSMSDRPGKSSVHRSKTISERELQVASPRQSGDVKASKDDISKILMRSQETNLDDLLMENVDYLSDIETNDPWGVHKAGKKSEPGHLREGLHMRAKQAQSGLNKEESSSLESLERKLKSDKSSHQKLVQLNQAASEKHRKDISTSKSVSASSTSAQPSISTAQTQAKSSTSSQPSSQPPSHSSRPSTNNSYKRNSFDHQQTSLEKTSQTLREVAQSTGEVTPPASNSETLTEQQGREIEQKKRRKDKSAMRKSQLNAGQEDSEGVKGKTLDNPQDDLDVRTREASASPKFSGSDRSSGESGDSSPRRRVNLHRQEACAVGSSDDSDSRRTPERTQSLRLKKTPSPEETKGVQRSESFKSDFMRKCYSPETVLNTPLEEDPESMATPNPELAAILNRRHKVVTDQQMKGQELEREQIYSKKVEKEDQIHRPAEVDEVICDSQVASVLKSRLNETELMKSKEDKYIDRCKTSHKTEDIITDTEVASILKARKKETDSKLPDDNKIVNNVCDQSSQKESVTSRLVCDDNVNKSEPSSLAPVQRTKVRDDRMTVSVVGSSVSQLLTSTKQQSPENKPTTQSQKLAEKAMPKESIDKATPKESIDKATPKESIKKATPKESINKATPKESIDIVTPKESIVTQTSPMPHVVSNIKSAEISDKGSDKEKSPLRSPRSSVSPCKDNVSSESTTLSKSSTVRRAESYGAKDTERPKGILKRTKSMKSSVIVDEELASILRQRKKEQDSDDSDDNGGEKVPDVALDIKETLRREQEHRNGAIGEGEGEGENVSTPRLSMQERIFQMQNKLEEAKSCPITPRAKSGTTTPKFTFKGRTGSLTPHAQSTDEPSSASVCGEQLIQKLSNLAERGHKVGSLAEKRQKFQQRKRDDWRTRTQPVTLEEIQAADGLQSVADFRREVLRKASKNVFDDLQKETKQTSGKKSEFPQHIPREKLRRTRSERYKTLPITAAELNAIPEGESIRMAGLRKKSDWSGARDSKADSGILSGSSDVENYCDSFESQASEESLRSLSLELDSHDEDPARLSVSAKASLFTNIVEKSKPDKPKPCASGAKRYIDRKKRERCQTQPVTEEEVKTAAEIADNTKSDSDKSELQEEENTDHAARQSLAEKVKLFSSLKEQQEKTPPRADPPVIRRRNRKQLTSRFNTQPVTIEEVEKAAQYRVSPLAMSMVKPPDPELMQGLSLAAQREIMAQHAEKVMSQPSSRQGSSVDLSDKSQSSSDLSKQSSEKEESVSSSKPVEQQLNKSISKSESDVKSILRSDSGKGGEEPRSILKHHHVETHEELKRIMLEREEHRSILKSSSPSQGTEQKGILKTPRGKDEEGEEEEEEKGGVQEEIVKGALRTAGLEDLGSDSEPKGILKKESSFEVKKSEPEKSVLKESTFEIHKEEPEKSVLKESSFEVPKSEPEKGVLKSSHQKDDADVQGILKKDQEEEVKESRVEEVRRTEEKSPSPERKSAGGCAASIRRRKDRRSQERFLTQPNDKTSPEKSPEGSPKLRYGATRHKTQPITPEEKREAEGSQSSEVKVSVKDRLTLLKKSGEEEWKKRLSKPADVQAGEVEVKLREKRGLDATRPHSIADRLNLLETSQIGWKGRVEENDAKRFTVAHKLAGQVEESPLMKKLRERSKRESESESGSPDILSPSTPTRDLPKIPLPKTIISGPPVEAETEAKPKEVKVGITMAAEEVKAPVKVEVPSMDDEVLKSFFRHSSEASEVHEKINVTVEDFNELFIIANDMLPTMRKIRPKRKHTTSARNPLKTTSVEIRTEYEEVKMGYAELEIRRKQKEKIADKAGFAEAALAGLASKENFASVALRKTGEPGMGLPSRLDPYKDLMLIHVKGRRRVQVRLVEPSAKSINSGDCYILVTPDKVITWVGEFANVIEKAKAADIATFIVQKKDLGTKATLVETVEEKRHHLGTGKKFWSAIGGLKTISSAGPTEEDELYENHIMASNMVYKLESNSLVPYQEFWGGQPKHEMLKKDQVLVFDFGTELYVWQGKAVKPERRKMGVKLARQLYEKAEEMGGMPAAAKERPAWGLFGKVNQNMETILFREKFSDWPDTSRLIKVKSLDAGSKTDLTELKPYDAKLMIPVNKSAVSLVLEGSNVGRGNLWHEDMEGFIREQDIVTLGVTVWHVLEYEHYKMPEPSFGQFHDGDTYVVRWQYMITSKGMNLKGTQSRKSLVGRERCAYFFWQGKNSTINEKGASALMTVELDEERGPQVRVAEGKEMPCFLNLFKGRMITHIGKREDEATNTQGAWRCYCVRGEYENETCLIEIPMGADRLRSRASFIMLNVKSGLLFVWHGCKSPPHCREMASKAAERLKEKCPLEVGVKEGLFILIAEMEEGSEKPEFWSALGVKANTRSLYCSHLTDPTPYDYTLRVFHMTSVSGNFDVHEILNPSRSPDLSTPFPVLQADLYNVSQPGLFLVDDDNIVYLWHGWWKEADAEVENVHTGSAKSRFSADRKCAIETALHYCKEKNPETTPKAVAVYAGLEPLDFTNLLPYWDVDESAKSLNLRDGKQDGEMTSLEDILGKMTKTRYTYEELLEDDLPEGVDPKRLESYLDDEEFEEIMEISREEFYKLPQWKQDKIKQQVGLF